MLHRICLIQRAIHINHNVSSVCWFQTYTRLNQEKFKNELSGKDDSTLPTHLTGNKKAEDLIEKAKMKVFEVMSIYEEAIGLKEIKEAQDNVLEVYHLC